MHFSKNLAGSLLLALSLLPAAAAAKLGDAAAPLAIKDWIKGKAVDVKDGKNVYIVEFWATWCGPCRTSIPHLTDLQKKFKDKGVVVVGISDETADKVKPFVQEMAEKMDYIVACDDTRKTFEAYMTAYGQNGIPTAFIVNKESKVVWVGHPMAELDESIQAVLDGKYDLAAAVRKDDLRALMQDYQELAAKGDTNAATLGRTVLERAGTDPAALADLAFTIAANTENPNRDFGLADAALDQAVKAAGKETPRLIATRAIVRFESGKKEEGLALARKAVEATTDAQEKRVYENFVRVMESRLKAE